MSTPTRTSFVLPDSLRVALTKRAATEERSQGFIIRRALCAELGIEPEPEELPDTVTPELPFAI